MIEPGDSIC